MAELTPPVLQQHGLIEAIRWWTGIVRERYGLEVEVSAPETRLPLELPVETALFQAAKELLQNAVKHAQATRASVLLSCDEEGISLTISDNGVGFDPEQTRTTDSSGFGLFSLRERMSYLGGNVMIESAPGAGTRATISLPMACLD